MKLNTSSKSDLPRNMIRGLRTTMTLKAEMPNSLIFTNCNFTNKTKLRMVRNPDHTISDLIKSVQKKFSSLYVVSRSSKTGRDHKSFNL